MKEFLNSQEFESLLQVHQLMNNLEVEGNVRQMAWAIFQLNSSCWKTLSIHPYIVKHGMRTEMKDARKQLER